MVARPLPVSKVLARPSSVLQVLVPHLPVGHRGGPTHQGRMRVQGLDRVRHWPLRSAAPIGRSDLHACAVRALLNAAFVSARTLARTHMSKHVRVHVRARPSLFARICTCACMHSVCTHTCVCTGTSMRIVCTAGCCIRSTSGTVTVLKFGLQRGARSLQSARECVRACVCVCLSAVMCATAHSTPTSSRRLSASSPTSFAHRHAHGL